MSSKLDAATSNQGLERGDLVMDACRSLLSHPFRPESA